MMLKNPFALRNGQIIMIEDVPLEERGLDCNCICPACREPFIARLGEIKVHHFAHSGKGCNELNAYMMGLYMILDEYIKKGNPVLLPAINIIYPKSEYSFITEENIYDKIRITSEEVNGSNVINCTSKKRIVFEQSEIISNDGKPEAIIASWKEHKLAIRITPPDTVCAYGKVSRYKDYSTLELNLSGEGTRIQEYTKEKLFEYLRRNERIYNWLYNAHVEEQFPLIIERSKIYYNEQQEKIRIRNEKIAQEVRERALQEKMEQEKRERERVERLKAAQEKAAKEARERAVRINQEKAARQERFKNSFRTERLKNPDKIINYWVNDIQKRDPGRDEIGCAVCGKDKLPEEFISVGTIKNVVVGMCIDCYEEISSAHMEKLWENIYD